MKRYIILIIALIVLFSGCADGLYLKDGILSQNDNAEILPDDNYVQKLKSTLYFAVENENYLIPELRELLQIGNESETQAVVRELIKGPLDQKSQRVINQKTRILGITTNNDFVYLSVSKEFLDVPAASGEWEKDPIISELVHKQRRMAIYSVVNTLTELKNCTYVQLYIDMDMDGTAEKVSRGQVGFVGDGNEDMYLDALSRSHDYILTPANTVRLVMELISKNQPKRLYNFVNVADDYGNVMSYADFEKLFNSNGIVIGGFTVDGEVSVSNYGNTFTVLVDYTVKTAGNYNVTVYNDVPVNIVRKGNYYCVDMNFIKKVLRG